VKYRARVRAIDDRGGSRAIGATGNGLTEKGRIGRAVATSGGPRFEPVRGFAGPLQMSGFLRTRVVSVAFGGFGRCAPNRRVLREGALQTPNISLQKLRVSIRVRDYTAAREELAEDSPVRGVFLPNSMTMTRETNATWALVRLRPRHRRFAEVTKKTPTTRVAFIAALLALALVPVAFAGKGNGGSGSATGGSYTVTVSPTGPYFFGEAIYVTTNAPIYPNGAGPYIWLRCYEKGVLVASGDHAAFPGGWYYNWPFNLGPTGSWSGGAASCTVSVVHKNNNKVVTDASTSFEVSA
jgi:hypothetical protein